MVQDRIYNYFERNPQLHVLFIFDRMDIIGVELREATWDETTYVFRIFDGAWFNIKYRVENDWKDKRVVLLFPETTYPRTEEEMLKFPLLDLLKANMEYKEENHEQFMQQYSLPAKYSTFIKKNISEITSAKITALLQGYFNAEMFSEDVVCRGFICSYLNEKKLLDWNDIIIRLIILGATSETKKRNDFFLRLEKNRDAKKALNKRLETIFNLTYNPNSEVKMKQVAESLKYNSLTQLLAPLPSDNYKEYKITNSFQLDLMNKVYETGIHNPLLCNKFLEALNELAVDIKEETLISCYGIDAAYFYMTEKLCWPILKETVSSSLVADPAEVNKKMRELSLKLPMSSDTQIVIRFIEQMALYYDKVRSVGTLKLNTPNDYVNRYTTEFYTIDLLYRRSLEAYHHLITKDIPIEHELSVAKKSLDQDYAKMSNVINLEWLTCINEHKDKFDSISLPKQQDFFDKELDASTKKVVIVCDALRYEVAAELMDELAKEKHIAKLSAMRAAMPTETKYCKPALLPHHSLELQGAEMLVDGQILSTVEQRTAHINKYREGAVCINYEDVMNGSALSARELFKRPLVYIFYNTIDETSHNQSPFETIRACRTAIEQLAVLIKRLHATWNVTNVLVTTDHGFIYNDIKFEEKDKHSVEDSFIEKKPRYYLTTSDDKTEGICKYDIERVSGMKSAQHVNVAVPIGTNRLAASGGYSFAHGGAAMQEMIIPLIHSTLRRKDKTEKVGVSLINHNLNMVSSQLRFQIIQTEAVSMTVMERRVTCCIYDGDQPVTIEKELMLNSTDSQNLNNRVFEISLVLSKSVSSNMLQLRIWDSDDKLNPLIKETVKNNTIIEQDF